MPRAVFYQAPVANISPAFCSRNRTELILEILTVFSNAFLQKQISIQCQVLCYVVCFAQALTGHLQCDLFGMHSGWALDTLVEESAEVVVWWLMYILACVSVDSCLLVLLAAGASAAGGGGGGAAKCPELERK